MSYDVSYQCPFLATRFCLSAYLCPCFVSSIVYARLFNNSDFSLFAFFLVPFGAYGIRRYVITAMGYSEDYEVSILKSLCCCNSMAQDINEMRVRKIGLYRYLKEPMLENDQII